MELANSYLEEGFPFQGRKRKKMEEFLEKSGLTYDPQIIYSVLLCREDGEIIGCGSRHENILKCIAVDEAYQGEGLLQRIVTQLIKQAYTCSIPHLFLFTKPEYRTVFTDMGFYTITGTDSILLLENRKDGISRYLEQELARHPLPSKEDAGAIVMNANPFTCGHRYLTETAARVCSVLHVFVLSADASEFPADVRLRLVEEGCRDLKNVVVHGSSEYLISHATFPDYFLKDKAGASDRAAELDLKIFANHFRDAFHITKRFVGEEPFSLVTRAYNEQMKRTLPACGIEVVEIPRKTAGDTVISATYVREKFLKGDWDALRPLVPDTTYRYLVSEAGTALRKQLLERQS